MIEWLNFRILQLSDVLVGILYTGIHKRGGSASPSRNESTLLKRVMIQTRIPRTVGGNLGMLLCYCEGIGT